jgi:NAD+ diphosphatase
VDLREAYKLLPRPEYDAAGKAFQLLFWDETHCRCGRCGAPTERRGELSRVCTECGLEIFPEVWPAIIVLVRRGREALLVHARNFRRPVYGLVAGFVETGESLEECVRREVKEETDLEIRNIRYMGSQPWPYPNSLMLGFTAEYAGGEVRFADEELTSGGFFTADNLPPLPGPPSIARQLIDNWLEELL